MACPSSALDLDQVLGDEPEHPAGESVDAVDEQVSARLADKAREGGLQPAPRPVGTSLHRKEITTILTPPRVQRPSCHGAMTLSDR